MRNNDVIAHNGAWMWWEHKRKEGGEESKENAWSNNDGAPPKFTTKYYNTKQHKREAENNSISHKLVTSPLISKSQRKQR